MKKKIMNMCLLFSSGALLFACGSGEPASSSASDSSSASISEDASSSLTGEEVTATSETLIGPYATMDSWTLNGESSMDFSTTTIEGIKEMGIDVAKTTNTHKKSGNYFSSYYGRSYVDSAGETIYSFESSYIYQVTEGGYYRYYNGSEGIFTSDEAPAYSLVYDFWESFSLGFIDSAPELLLRYGNTIVNVAPIYSCLNDSDVFSGEFSLEKGTDLRLDSISVTLDDEGKFLSATIEAMMVSASMMEIALSEDAVFDSSVTMSYEMTSIGTTTIDNLPAAE